MGWFEANKLKTRVSVGKQSGPNNPFALNIRLLQIVGSKKWSDWGKKEAFQGIRRIGKAVKCIPFSLVFHIIAIR